MHNSNYKVIPRVMIKVLENNTELVVPTYATRGSSGMDIRSCEDIHLAKGETKMIHTGFAVCIPEGFEIQIRSRSGLAKKKGVFVTNGVGTIDSDYRGEVCVLLTCLGVSVDDASGLTINKGDRIAQMVVSRVEQADLVLVEELTSSERDTGGFGSTGTT